MHELAICEAIAGNVARHSDGQPVARVEVRIGAFRQVVPDSLTFSWELLTAGSDLEGCELALDLVPAVIDCHGCGATSTLVHPIMCCPACDGVNVDLVSGDEFMIVAIERTPVAH